MLVRAILSSYKSRAAICQIRMHVSFAIKRVVESCFCPLFVSFSKPVSFSVKCDKVLAFCLMCGRYSVAVVTPIYIQLPVAFLICVLPRLVLLLSVSHIFSSVPTAAHWNWLFYVHILLETCLQPNLLYFSIYSFKSFTAWISEISDTALAHKLSTHQQGRLQLY